MIFDSAGKKKVTSDWAQLFPSLKAWKPGRLLKRHGPLLIGICLDGDRTRKIYSPKAHFHVLSIPCSTVALELVGELEDKGLPVHVRLDRHEQELQSTAEALRLKYRFLDNQNFEFNDFVAAAENYLNGKHGRTGQVPFQHAPFEGIISVAAYLGQLDYAQAALYDFCGRMLRWPARGWNVIGNPDTWRTKLQGVIDSPSYVRETVAAQLKEHKLEGIPDYGLTWSDTPRVLP